MLRLGSKKHFSVISIGMMSLCFLFGKCSLNIEKSVSVNGQMANTIYFSFRLYYSICFSLLVTNNISETKNEKKKNNFESSKIS